MKLIDHLMNLIIAQQIVQKQAPAAVVGIISTLLSPSRLIRLGFANLLTEGFSMTVGNNLGIKTRLEFTT